MPSFDLDPLSKVKSTAMKDIDILGRQEVNHEHDKGRDPHKHDMLPDPPYVIVQSVLQQRTTKNQCTVKVIQGYSEEKKTH